MFYVQKFFYDTLVTSADSIYKWIYGINEYKNKKVNFLL